MVGRGAGAGDNRRGGFLAHHEVVAHGQANEARAEGRVRRAVAHVKRAHEERAGGHLETKKTQ